MAACRQADPVAREIEKEFDIPYYNSWVVVLDAKGETLASYMGDTAGQGCTKESAGEFPAKFSRKIEESLKGTESLQAQERHWRGTREQAAYDALLKRLQGMGALHRLAATADEAAADASLPGDLRDAARIDGFLARAQVGRTPENSQRLLEEGERLLVASPGHARIPEVIRVLVGELTKAPDPGSAVSDCLARLDAEAGKTSSQELFRSQVKALSESCHRQALAAGYYRLLRDYLAQVRKPDGQGDGALGEKILAQITGNPDFLNEFAWMILTQEGILKRDPGLALRAAKAALDASGGRSPHILDTYARALFDNGKVAEAVAAQGKALELCRDEALKAELRAALERYQKAAGPGQT